MSSFIVIGMGRFGSSVATELFKLGHEVLAIDESEDAISRISDYVTHAIVGDAKDEYVLQSIGVDNFDCAIVSIAQDLSDSIIITLLLKEMGVEKIVCKAQDDRHSKALTLIGADVIIKPEYDMGKRLAYSLTENNIIDFIELSPDHSILEMEAPKSWINKTILEENLRKKFGVTLLAIRDKNSSDIIVSPNADYKIKASDILVIIGKNEDLDRIENK